MVACAVASFYNIFPDYSVIVLQYSKAGLTLLDALREVVLIALVSPYCWAGSSKTQLSEKCETVDGNFDGSRQLFVYLLKLC